MAEQPQARPTIVQPVDQQQQQAAAAARAAAEAAAELAEHPRDETEPGGRYLVDGELVNADGEPVKKKD